MAKEKRKPTTTAACPICKKNKGQISFYYQDGKDQTILSPCKECEKKEDRLMKVWLLLGLGALIVWVVLLYKFAIWIADNVWPIS